MSRATFTKIESPTLPKSHPLHTVYAARVGNTEFRIARDGKGWCVDLYGEMGVWERTSKTYPTLTAAKAAFKRETSKLRRNSASAVAPKTAAERKNPSGIYHETHKGITIYRYIKPSGYGFEEYGTPATRSIVEARALVDEHLRKKAEAHEASKSDAQKYWDALSTDERSKFRRDPRMWDYDSVEDFAYALRQKSNPRQRQVNRKKSLKWLN